MSDSAGDALTWLGHAGVCLDLAGTRVVTDPLLRRHVGPLRRYGELPPAACWQRPDVVVISHLHHDHLDRPSLRRLGPDVPVVVPAGAGPLLDGHTDVREVVPGDEIRIGNVTITAVPARHPDDRLGAGVHAPALGYVLGTAARSVYFAGDTGLFPGLRELRGACEVALLPVGGWGPTLGPGHLDPRQAAAAADLVGAARAMPIHYGTLFVPGLYRALPRRSRDAGTLFARWAARLAPATDVTVATPGERVPLR